MSAPAKLWIRYGPRKHVSHICGVNDDLAWHRDVLFWQPNSQKSTAPTPASINSLCLISSSLKCHRLFIHAWMLFKFKHIFNLKSSREIPALPPGILGKLHRNTHTKPLEHTHGTSSGIYSLLRFFMSLLHEHRESQSSGADYFLDSPPVFLSFMESQRSSVISSFGSFSSFLTELLSPLYK